VKALKGAPECDCAQATGAQATASGETIQELLAGYPGLMEADILACIAYGAEMSRERFVEIPLETKQ